MHREWRPVVFCIVALTAVALTHGAAQAGVPSEPPPPTPVPTTPTLAVAPTALRTGETAIVVGDGWPAGVPVAVEVCGTSARGIAGCAPVGTVPTGPDGVLAASLVIVRPPGTCPCALRASIPSLAATATVLVDLTDVGVGPPEPAEPTQPGEPEPGDPEGTVADRLEVTGVEVRDDGGIGAWFGLPAERTLVLTVRNPGSEAVDGAAVTLAVGKGDDLDPVATPPLGPVPAGGEVTYEAGFELDALAFGEHAVVGRITGAAEPVEFATTTTPRPWGLVVVVVLAVTLVVLLLVRARGRRRGPVAVPEPAAEPEPAVPGRVDGGSEALDATIAEELGAALAATFDEHGDGPRTDQELVTMAARLAHVTAVRTARRHGLDAATTRTVLVGVFAELTERLHVGDDPGEGRGLDRGGDPALEPADDAGDGPGHNGDAHGRAVPGARTVGPG